MKLREFINLARIIPNDTYFETSIRALATVGLNPMKTLSRIVSHF